MTRFALLVEKDVGAAWFARSRMIEGGVAWEKKEAGGKVGRDSRSSQGQMRQFLVKRQQQGTSEPEGVQQVITDGRSSKLGVES